MNTALNKGRSTFNIDHVFVSSFVWDLPFLLSRKGVIRAALGGWQLNGIASMRSGQPFDVLPGTATSLSGTGGERANLAGDPFLSGDRPRQERLDRWFNTAAFAVAPSGSWGNFGRNVLEGPGHAGFNLVFGKRFAILEHHFLDFRSEFFNALNTPSFSTPVSTVTNNNFGKVTSAGSGRVVQLALKYSF